MSRAFRIAITFCLGLLFAAAPNAFAEEPKTDCSTSSGPDTPVALSVDGNKQPLPVAQFRDQQAMSSGEEMFEVFQLELRDTESLFSPREIAISVMVKKGETVDGKTFRQLPIDDLAQQPGPVKSGSVSMPEVQNIEVRSDPDGFDYQHGVLMSMRLEFGNHEGENQPGRIHLCIAGGQKDDVFQPQPTHTIIVEGTFVSKIQ